MDTVESTAWLEDFYARFEAETRLLYKTEPFWRLCQKCPDGHCCSRIIYSVKDWEGNPFIVEDWRRMLTYVRDFFSLGEKAGLIKTIFSNPEDCIFLAGGRCSIHPARPWSCRVHPYTVSFHPNRSLFPVGELELPSCPGLAPFFGLKNDQTFVQRALVTARDTNSNLVMLKLKKHKPVWLIDASAYFREYENNMPPANRPDSDWVDLFALAKQAGGEQGDILARYVEKVTARKSPRKI